MNKYSLITFITFATMVCVPMAGMSQKKLNKALIKKIQSFPPYFLEEENTEEKIEEKIKEIKALIDDGADVNCMVDKNCPLHAAVLANQPKAVLFLLEKGADINKKDGEGDTPLRAACYAPKNRIELIKILLQNKANLDIKDHDGDSLLHIGVQLGNTELINLFLQHGANLDATDKNGRTPLSMAIRSNNEELINLFLEKGANPNIIDHNGFPTFHWICLKTHDGADLFSGEIKNSLLKYGIRTGLNAARYHKNCHEFALAQQLKTPNSKNLQKIKRLYQLEHNTPLLQTLVVGIKHSDEIRPWRERIQTIISENTMSTRDTNIYHENALFILLLQIISTLDTVENKNIESPDFYRLKAILYMDMIPKILTTKFDNLSLKEKIKIVCNKSSVDRLTILDLCEKISKHPAYISNNFFPYASLFKEDIEKCKSIITNLLLVSESLPKSDIGITMGSKESLSRFGNMFFE